ncbi:bifunctional 2-polyprenyl-6-hydroxyphenol methylase/3-demethylubiquinol 3-O-methyltransferase UbiG [Alteromonas sediminis]|uniref:Ubiquinone biosynthesis O-methyltransferase n=1 Tax=Alteromonas sediminis TaxID=2259342 RepID=A0A3N5Z933_9ALTE|nr:bifunctional 2-polyprenyl-6-hydroxyphenol methylase/3-demethylubiquinol 3-O-methyltransferase UbiG [Alteromonas sediminis]RPJ67454.1 bifunctional 2-polyprenyl-6-hydroxyphenol methylase/3-demethylubiquinol 3-O-methyltransferase UbiG [Alteromonas sediminis]
MQNVDENEISKFANLASRWWDPEGEFKPLHLINPLRVDYIEEQVNGLFGKRVIDVGCGGGLVAEALARAGADVTGIDMAEASLEVARLHGLESGVTVDYQLSSAEAFAEHHKGSFDVVTCLEMLEHVPSPANVVKACADMLKPGGIAIFSTINRNPKSYLMAIVAAEYVLNWVPKGTHDFKRFIQPSELISMCDQADLKTVQAMGMHYHPIKSTFYMSDTNIDVNYLITCIKPA